MRNTVQAKYACSSVKHINEEATEVHVYPLEEIVFHKYTHLILFIVVVVFQEAHRLERSSNYFGLGFVKALFS